jgi:hypothetical protein
MPNLIRFGEFALHPHSGELLWRASRVKLQNQPLQVLMLLLEHPREVVTREELRERLWPSLPRPSRRSKRPSASSAPPLTGVAGPGLRPGRRAGQSDRDSR